ncbi:hypothetical protein C9374_004515 [Naegleria lovaniensis]|uniref:Nuclear transcription factor Y subunit n=1 Tax=Naegleria lovaniensis TaxID=51637 RepID=A0AA88KKM6_NAELO|nr:uncharacterized protein C9374_004515 [Naegleria lovaniensis]KAG2383178.1 hypothetical protein C9374_004515 [Naegleria lovaniensis]
MDDTWNFEKDNNGQPADYDDNTFQDGSHSNNNHHDHQTHSHHDESVPNRYSQPNYEDAFEVENEDDDAVAQEMIKHLVSSSNNHEQAEDDGEDHYTTPSFQEPSVVLHDHLEAQQQQQHNFDETAHSIILGTTNNSLISSLNPSTITSTTPSSDHHHHDDSSLLLTTSQTMTSKSNSTAIMLNSTTDAMKTVPTPTNTHILSPSLSTSHVPKSSSIPSRSSAAMISRGTEFLMMEDHHASGTTFLPPPLGVPVLNATGNTSITSPLLGAGKMNSSSTQLHNSQVFSHTTPQQQHFSTDVSSLTPIQPSTSQASIPASPKKVRTIQSKENDKSSTRSNNEATEDNNSNLEVLSTTATSTTHVFSPAYMHSNLMHSFYMGDMMYHPDMQHWVYPYGYPTQTSFWNYGFQSYPHGTMQPPNGEHHLMGSEEHEEMLSSHPEMNHEHEAQQQHLAQQTQQFSADASNSAGEGTIYVNPKQYQRILKRRIARAKLENQMKNAGQKEKASYKYNSRHEWAKKRARGPGGRFLSKKEKEKLEQAEKEKNDASTTENFASIEGSFDTSSKPSRSSKKKRETAPLNSSIVPPPMFTAPNMIPLVGPPQHIAYPKTLPTMMEDINLPSASSHRQ